MNRNTTVLTHEPAAFALPTSLDRSPLYHFAFSDFENCRLNESFTTLEALGLNAPVLALDAADVATLVEPIDRCMHDKPIYSSTDRHDSNVYIDRSTSHRKTQAHRDGPGTTPSMLHRHHFKRTSRKELLELQTKVLDMQTQVDCATTEFQQLAQLVDQFAYQREQEKHEHEAVRRQEQHERERFDEREINMGLDEQQMQLRAQVEHDVKQFEREQQRCMDYQTAQSSPEQEQYRF
ncbi:uncharacterized protein PHALS_09386 [Plasmopara halstedii]|uniref:Uncharacterized protein n=1 Tax=Plasmopara halstedii TaxID=4781 RepID=A0A0P1A4A7_PLAHL|nr:uncharacterized protein PHALS_09386 [Plasmopara halstedii]CEG35258.1 hypothetical protein PHALS_09386 [Plasmopara halstedii]|eukprot:XP_024571627.1 hypothetical protein PHALS_09386 [Plasmopara halstedii]